jgi:hypothetical protein
MEEMREKPHTFRLARRAQPVEPTAGRGPHRGSAWIGALLMMVLLVVVGGGRLPIARWLDNLARGEPEPSLSLESHELAALRLALGGPERVSRDLWSLGHRPAGASLYWAGAVRAEQTGHGQDAWLWLALGADALGRNALADPWARRAGEDARAVLAPQLAPALAGRLERSLRVREGVAK